MSEEEIAKMSDDRFSSWIRKAEYRADVSDAIVLILIFGVAGAALYFAHQWGTSHSRDALEPKPQVTVLVVPISPSPIATVIPGLHHEN